MLQGSLSLQRVSALCALLLLPLLLKAASVRTLLAARAGTYTRPAESGTSPLGQLSNGLLASELSSGRSNLSV
jgi:hypothetical protein